MFKSSSIFLSFLLLSSVIILTFVSAEHCSFHNNHFTCARDKTCNWCATTDDFSGGCCLDMSTNDSNRKKAGDECSCAWASEDQQDSAQMRFFFGLFMFLLFLRFYAAHKRNQEIREEMERMAREEQQQNPTNQTRERVVVRRIITVRDENGQEHDEEVEQELFDTSAVVSGGGGEQRQQEQQLSSPGFYNVNQFLQNLNFISRMQMFRQQMLQQQQNGGGGLPVARHTTPDSFALAQVEMGTVIDNTNRITTSSTTSVVNVPETNSDESQAEATVSQQQQETSQEQEKEEPQQHQQQRIAPPMGYALPRQ